MAEQWSTTNPSPPAGATSARGAAGSPAPRNDQADSVSRSMGRSAALLYLGGALIGTLIYALPTPAEANDFVIFLLAFLGYPISLMLFLFGQRIAACYYHGVLFAGTLMLTGAVYFGGPTALGASTASIYVWVPLWLCYFFPLWQGMIHVGLITVLSAVAILAAHGQSGIVVWVTLVGTNLIAAVTVGTLAKRNRDMARVDALTGAFNRHEWEEAAAREMHRADRFGHDVSLVYLDLDHFKSINDTLGHAAGDELLRTLGRSALGHLRREDLFARIGGDEFALLLPNCPHFKVIQIIERLGESLPQGCTLSAGVASRVQGEAWDALQRRADQALYAAKNAGRNTFRVAK